MQTITIDNRLSTAKPAPVTSAKSAPVILPLQKLTKEKYTSYAADFAALRLSGNQKNGKSY